MNKLILCSLLSVLSTAAFAVGMQNIRGSNSAAPVKMVAAVEAENVEEARVGSTQKMVGSANTSSPFGVRASGIGLLRASSIDLAAPKVDANPCAKLGDGAKKSEDGKCLAKVSAYNGETALGVDKYIAAGESFECNADLFGIASGGTQAKAEIKFSGDMDGRENLIQIKCSADPDWIAISIFDASSGLARAIADAINENTECENVARADAAGKTLTIVASKGGARGNRTEYNVAPSLGVSAAPDSANGKLSGAVGDDDFQCRVTAGENFYFGQTGNVKSIE